MTRRKATPNWKHTPDTVQTTFARTLKDAMTRNGFGNIELSNMTGFSEQQISNWLNKRHLPNSAQLVLLSQVLHEPIDTLLEPATKGFTPARIYKPKKLYRDIRDSVIEKSAEKLWLQIRIGNAARECLDTISDVLEEKRLEVRLLICDNTDISTKEMLRRRKFILEDGEELDVDKDIPGTISKFQNMVESSPTTSILRVMTIPFLPSYVAYIVDPHLSTGVLLTAISGFERKHFDTPTMIVSKKADEETFKFYTDQYDDLWRFGENWQRDEVWRYST